MPEATQPVRTETQVSLPPAQMRSTNTCCFQSQYIFVGSNISLWTSCGKQNPYLPIRNCNPLTSMKGNVTLMALKLPRIHLYHYDYLSILFSALNCERFEIRDCVFSQSLRQVWTEQLASARRRAGHGMFHCKCTSHGPCPLWSLRAFCLCAPGTLDTRLTPKKVCKWQSEQSW